VAGSGHAASLEKLSYTRRPSRLTLFASRVAESRPGVRLRGTRRHAHIRSASDELDLSYPQWTTGHRDSIPSHHTAERAQSSRLTNLVK